MANKTVEKVIYYGVLNWKKDNKPSDISFIFESINNLSFDDGSRYLENSNGQRYEVILNDAKTDFESCIYGCIGDSRNNNLPFLENKGTLSPLKIEEGTGVFDASHFLIRRNQSGNWIIVYEYNHYAPRIASLNAYVMNKFSDLVDYAEINVVSGESVSKILKYFSAIRKLTFGTYTNTDISEISPGLNSALQQIKDEQQCNHIEISLSVDRKKDSKLENGIIQKLPTLFKNSVPQMVLDNLSITGYNTNSKEYETVNLLDIVLKTKKHVAKLNDDYRFVDETKMYSALEDAYKNQKEVLESL